MFGKGIKRLSSESLIQALVALIIITSIITIGVMIFLNITSSSNNFQKVSARLIMEEVAVKTKKDKSYFNEELIVQNLRVIKVIERYKGELFLLEFRVFDAKNQNIGHRRELIVLE